MRRFSAALVCIVFNWIALRNAAEGQWKPAHGPIRTRWAKDVGPQSARPEYPRPQMVRKDWLNLNGLWDYAIRPRGEDRPAKYDGQILVPFPIESALSGVMRRVGPDNRLWYRRKFSVPPGWQGKRICLHFEAVDWETTCWIDGKELPVHRGGYTPFTHDLTAHLGAGDAHELIVSVWDPSDAGTQPCGKQHNKPEGIWYTPSTGIWQTVWLEPVPEQSIRSLEDKRQRPTAGFGPFVVEVQHQRPGQWVRIEVFEPADGARPRNKVGEGTSGKLLTTVPENLHPWSPETPYLYEVEARLYDDDGHGVDFVTSYTALRSVRIAAQAGGPARLELNERPAFLIGPLDQGFWPDGLYTAPTEEAMKHDLEVTKQLGFNLIRKHVKVEPAVWYYWCDKLGIAVWQDMPNGDRHAKWPSAHAEIKRSSESAAAFEAEWKTVIDARRHFPCIVAWVPFNEGWGQYDTVRITKWTQSYDSRPVIPASGGNDFPVPGSIHDVHKYPGPDAPPIESGRAAVLGEFGGLGLPILGHLWMDRKNWGYRSFKNADELTAAYLGLTKKLEPLVRSHLSAAVYTQTTDVETEVNGLMTYDREVIKMNAAKVREANLRLRELIK